MQSWSAPTNPNWKCKLWGHDLWYEKSWHNKEEYRVSRHLATYYTDQARNVYCRRCKERWI
jgi:hypothetical protein